jgi:hypothetical protein
VLAAYLAWGEDFAAHLNGTFLVAVWDELQARLIVANDRLGLYPCIMPNSRDFRLRPRSRRSWSARSSSGGSILRRGGVRALPVSTG